MEADKLRLLLVEDIPINMELEKLVFERGDFEVTPVTGGQDALQQLELSDFDVVILDIKLPDMNGLDVVRWIRQNPRLKNLPVVAITALAMKGDREHALECGFNAYITKPIDTRTLAETIWEIVKNLRETEEDQEPDESEGYEGNIS